MTILARGLLFWTTLYIAYDEVRVVRAGGDQNVRSFAHCSERRI